MNRRTALKLGAATGAASALGLAARASATTYDYPVLVAVAHPDDETLGVAQGIRGHITAGRDVHVAVLTRGTASSVRRELNGETTSAYWGTLHIPADEGYSPMTEDEFGDARIREFTAACHALASGGPGKLTLHVGNLQDGQVTMAAAQAAILDLCDQIAPDGKVGLKGHSPIVENHPDHIAIGKALVSLKAADAVRFGDVRHYILPAYWSDTRLSQVTHWWENPTVDEKAHIINAIRAYSAWAPPQSYAIGAHSVSMFNPLLATPRSMVHS